MKDGQKITFRGEGDQEPGLEPGDIIIILDEREHSTFKRRGSDLIMQFSLELTEALCGFKRTIPHAGQAGDRHQHASRWDRRAVFFMHWASKETCHFFKATLIKIHPIKMSHISTQISYGTPYWAYQKKQQQRFEYVKGKNAVKLQMAILRKWQNLFTSWAHCMPWIKASMRVT